MDTNVGMDEVHRRVGAGQEVVRDQAGERQHVGERGLVAEAVEGGRDGHAARGAWRRCPCGRRSRPAGRPWSRRSPARRTGSVLVLSDPARPRSVVNSTMQAGATLAPREERMVLAPRAPPRRPRGPRPACRGTGRAWSVASWARLSFDAATNCIARVICLMFLTEPMRRRISRWLGTSGSVPPCVSWAAGAVPGGRPPSGGERLLEVGRGVAQRRRRSRRRARAWLASVVRTSGARTRGTGRTARTP